MEYTDKVTQDPAPGTHHLMFKGDTQSFTLSLSHPQKGKAWLRTNIGHAVTIREEIIKEVHNGEPPLGRDWFDIPMIRMDDHSFRIVLPLCEVGHFEAKCFFLHEGDDDPVWPEGPNVTINVEPADTCCANIIYNAFVRQFGPNKKRRQSDLEKENFIKSLDQDGYVVIPQSGTFRDLMEELDFIIGELGCRIIQLLPIHPTPTTYGRMGRFGSPFAALSFTAVDPALAEFDPRATPIEQFIELVDAIHQRNAKIFIDIAINHTGWAAAIHETHPHWLVRDPDGKIEVPGAWGVRWEDLTKLDYANKDLWQYMAHVFLSWCRRGVDGFRCDAGYMIPVSAWKYMVAKVRSQFPDTVFLLEGLGGKISVTRDILNLANLDWAYSELFQNYDRKQIEAYLPQSIAISQGDGITVHFAETHDNPRLAARSKIYAKMRTALCALCSSHGAFGFANGVEWLATEKINVHEASSLNWGATDHQINHIRRINHILKYHPAFHDQTELKLVQEGEENVLVLFRHHLPTGKKVVVVANLDDSIPTVARMNFQALGMVDSEFTDLITGKTIAVATFTKGHEIALDPGEVLCLSPDPEDIITIDRKSDRLFLVPERIERQRLRAKALEVFVWYHGLRDLGQFDPDLSAEKLMKDPAAYCQHLNSRSDESRVVTWCWPLDIKRKVMVPPNHFLLVKGDTPFRVCILDGKQVVGLEDSLPLANGSCFALFKPLAIPEDHRQLTLRLMVYTPGCCQHVDAPLYLLTTAENVWVRNVYKRKEFYHRSFGILDTNGRGGMLRARMLWGELACRYDALLAANLHDEFPVDRWVMFSRCRAWIVFQDYSQKIDGDCQTAFHFDGNQGFWQFQVPTGQGEHVIFTIGAKMVSSKNAVRIFFYRHPAKEQAQKLKDAAPIKLILRPDIEDRNFHETTKAYIGPENEWPQFIKHTSDGFSFEPHPDRILQMRISSGGFVSEPEWQYMVHRALEEERGMDPNSDLFSPGYFKTVLKGDEIVELISYISTSEKQTSPTVRFSHAKRLPLDLKISDKRSPIVGLKKALDHYMVKRNHLKSVIAGFPWFLDWGRDALIVVRGLVAAKSVENARAVLKLFGRFEKDGTLPNMIRGKDTGNRNTSDAPLWFFVACHDLICCEKNHSFLDEPCQDRTIRQILISIGHSLIRGSSNGVQIDAESGLLFSPAHFTWMDTNHPACTPRQGYPIEIQALWHFSLTFLVQIDPESKHIWEPLAEKVRSSILDLFMLDGEGYLSDCLHAADGTPARQTEKDDALRPNQLMAVTLGAIKDRTICKNIVNSCQELLIPGAIRSLADRPVQRSLPIVHNETVLNDPHRPYQGQYVGEEDTQRKPAYHNGTAWTWLFPSFCEAWVVAYGPDSRQTAMAWLSSGIHFMNEGCVGQVPEILDGNFPHTHRGCDAQAWGVSELLRVWLKLSDNNV
jgi:predicted glycogen debranching enzyme